MRGCVPFCLFVAISFPFRVQTTALSVALLDALAYHCITGSRCRRKDEAQSQPVFPFAFIKDSDRCGFDAMPVLLMQEHIRVVLADKWGCPSECRRERFVSETIPRFYTHPIW